MEATKAGGTRTRLVEQSHCLSLNMLFSTISLFTWLGGLHKLGKVFP